MHIESDIVELTADVKALGGKDRRYERAHELWVRGHPSRHERRIFITQRQHLGTPPRDCQNEVLDARDRLFRRSYPGWGHGPRIQVDLISVYLPARLI